jgi:hypothetical protein
MPAPLQLEKATLTELWPGADNKLAPQNKDGGDPKIVTVQFNPQSMKVNFSNQAAGGDQPNNSPIQFVGKSATKLTLELWFDVTLPLPKGAASGTNDVRKLTADVAYFLTPVDVNQGKKKGKAPPGVRFHWGTFLFEGVIDSMDETLDFFSNDGRPLRAQVNLALSKQEIEFQFGQSGMPPGSGPSGPGTQPLQAARQGDSLQQMASRNGISDWKSIASANGIENPRALVAGALVNMQAGVSISGSASVSGGVSLSAGASITGGASLDTGANLSIKFQL